MGGSSRTRRVRTRIAQTCRRCAEGDALNRSRIATVVCVLLTSNLRWADAPGNSSLSAKQTGLPKESVANISQLVTLDRALLTDRVGNLPRAKLDLILCSIDIVLGR